MHPLRTFIVGYIPQNVLSYTVSIPSYSTGIYELKEIKYIYGDQKYNTDNGCFTISRGVSRIVKLENSFTQSRRLVSLTVVKCTMCYI